MDLRQCNGELVLPAGFRERMGRSWQPSKLLMCLGWQEPNTILTIMILDERSAAVFIDGYQKLLLEICGSTGGNVKFLERLVEGRKKLMSDVSLLDDAVSRIHHRGQHVDETVVAAATRLQVKSWVYLRDTRRYSIFMEPAGKLAYGAVGITNPIKELLGGSGVLVETALLPYDGCIVCDGLMSPVAWIGPSYKRDFNEALSTIRSAGNFYADRLIPRSEQERGSVGL